MNTGIPSKEFVFRLENTRSKFYYLFAFFIIIINIVILSLIRLNDTEEPLQNWRLFGIIIYTVIFSILFFIRSEREKKTLIVITFVLIITAWFFMNEWLPAIINLITGLLFLISTRKLEIKVKKEIIFYPSFPVQKISWNELNNIILKDGLLTIDLKNNKVYQLYPEETKPVDEAAFNLFCKQMLQSAS